MVSVQSWKLKICRKDCKQAEKLQVPLRLAQIKIVLYATHYKLSDILKLIKSTIHN